MELQDRVSGPTELWDVVYKNLLFLFLYHEYGIYMQYNPYISS